MVVLGRDQQAATGVEVLHQPNTRLGGGSALGNAKPTATGRVGDRDKIILDVDDHEHVRLEAANPAAHRWRE